MGGCQVGAGKTNASEPLWKRRNALMASELGFEGVKPRVLWGLVYLVAVVAGCDCSWRWRSGAQAASCSAGARIPMAEYGRVVPAQCTHSAVASTGDINVLPRALVTDQLGLVQGA